MGSGPALPETPLSLKAPPTPMAKTSPNERYRLLTPVQRALYKVLVVLGILILANSIYLYGYTLFQDFSDARAKLLTSYQWMLMAHFGVGILFLGLVLGFVAVHVPRVRRHKNKKAMGTGAFAAACTVALLVTGFMLLMYGNSEQNRAVFHIHRLGGLFGLAAFMIHRWYSQHSPSTRLDRWRNGSLIAGGALMMAAVHATESIQTPAPPGVQAQAFEPLDISSDPFIPFDPLNEVDLDAPFWPSPTRLASGGKLDPDALMPGPKPDPEVLKAEFAQHGFTSSESIGAEDCRLCHQDIVEQWEDSAHRFSSFNNPFYTASVVGLRNKLEEGEVRSQWCGGCHDPGVMLAGDFTAEIQRDDTFAQAGITCTVCHLINSIHDVTGNGNYELADNGKDPYLFAEADEGLDLELRKYLIKARPRDHKDFFQRPFYSESEYCSTCHKVSLDVPVNNYKWLRGQNEYDNWHDSGVSRNAARTFYLPDTARNCQDCHMPLVDAPLGDLAAKDGKVRSHRFPGPNTALPYVRGDMEAMEEMERYLQEGKLRLDLFAIEHPREGLVMDPEHAMPELLPGDEIVVYTIVRNQGVGHTFPGGTNDSNQGWLRFEATDGEGNVVKLSGELDEEGFLGEEAHQYKAIMLDKHAESALERNAHDFHVAGLVRVIGPGNVDVARYRLTVPDSGRIDIEAKLLWRKFNRFYTIFSYNELGLEPPVLPITEITGDTLSLAVGGASGAGAEPADWVKYNDLGIGLLMQGDSRSSLRAFARVAELEPARVDGFRNQARVHILQGDPESALPLLQKCEDIKPGDPLTMLWWAEYLKLQGQLPAAAKMYREVLAYFPQDRDTWRRLSDVLFKIQRFDDSLDASLQVLRIDPEDVRSHYQRMLIYRATGQVEAEAHARAAFDKYRIDDNAPQIVKQWRLNNPVANREVEPRHVH